MSSRGLKKKSGKHELSIVPVMGGFCYLRIFHFLLAVRFSVYTIISSKAGSFAVASAQCELFHHISYGCRRDVFLSLLAIGEGGGVKFLHLTIMEEGCCWTESFWWGVRFVGWVVIQSLYNQLWDWHKSCESKKNIWNFSRKQFVLLSCNPWHSRNSLPSPVDRLSRFKHPGWLECRLMFRTAGWTGQRISFDWNLDNSLEAREIDHGELTSLNGCCLFAIANLVFEVRTNGITAWRCSHFRQIHGKHVLSFFSKTSMQTQRQAMSQMCRTAVQLSIFLQIANCGSKWLSRNNTRQYVCKFKAEQHHTRHQDHSVASNKWGMFSNVIMPVPL